MTNSYPSQHQIVERLQKLETNVGIISALRLHLCLPGAGIAKRSRQEGGLFPQPQVKVGLRGTESCPRRIALCRGFQPLTATGDCDQTGGGNADTHIKHISLTRSEVVVVDSSALCDLIQVLGAVL